MFSYNLYWPFLGLCHTLTASTDILRDPFKPLTASIDTLTASTDILTASTNTLTAPKALCSLQALSWLVIENSQELPHGCESVVEAVRVFNTLAASLGSPTITMGTLTAFISTLTASTDTFMASLHSHGPCKHSHTSATVSRPLVALSRTIQALSLPQQHFYGLYKHSVVRSCQLFFKIYIFTAHIVQKYFLKAMTGLLEPMRVLLEAMIVLLEAVRIFV
jgi:hypothetical protein